MKRIDQWLPAALLLFAGLVAILYGITLIPTPASTGPEATQGVFELAPVFVREERLVSGASLKAFHGKEITVEKTVASLNTWTLPEDLSAGDLVQYTAYFRAKETGEYVFKAAANCPVRLFINGEPVIENGAEASVKMQAGYYALRLEIQAGAEPVISLLCRLNGAEYSVSGNLYCTYQKTPNKVFGLASFAFLRGVNPALRADVNCTVNNSAKTVTALLPPGQPLQALIPTFSAGGTVTFNGQELISGVTPADFSGGGELRVQDGERERVFSVQLRTLDTGLPCLCINTFGADPIASKTDYVKATVAIVGNGASYGADLPETNAEVKIRGAYSSNWEKSPYMIKFGEHTAVLDLTAEKSWVLVASHLDLSLMRNYTGYETARRFSALDYTPRMRFVDVFVNGVYRGNYLLGDHVEISATKLDLNTRVEGEDIGCVLELEKAFRAEGTKGYHYFQTPQGWCVTFKDPNADKLTAAQRAYIANYFIRAENAIMRGEGYEEYIDVDSFIDWFLVETLFKNCDSDFTSSIYFHKDAGGKLKMGPVWDFDSGLANHSSNPTWMQPEGWEPRWGTYFEALMKDPAFRARMSARWAEMKPIAVDTYADLVDQTTALIEKSFLENFKVYSILQDGIWPVPANIASRKTIQGQADFMKTWVKRRSAWLTREFQKEVY